MRSRITAIVVGAAIMVGGYAAIQGGGGGGFPTTANLWVDIGAGACTRSATLVDYAGSVSPDARCGTFDQANDAAACADTIIVKGGSYGSTSVSGSPSCSDTWTMDANAGATCTSCIHFYMAAGETVTLGSFDTNADYVEYNIGDGAAFTAVDWGIAGTDVTSVIVNGLDIDAGGAQNGAFVNGVNATGSKIAWINGSINNWVGGTLGGATFYLQTCGSCGPNAILFTDFLIDGNTFDGNDNTPPGHAEVIRIDGGYRHVVVRNNTFTNNAMNTSLVFITNLETGTIDSDQIEITNNFFGSNADNGIFQCHTNVAGIDMDIEYNTFLDDAPDQLSCSPYTNLTWTGNLGPRDSSVPCNGTYSKNVWQDNVNSACGTDTWVSGSSTGTEALGLTGDGFHISSSSPARAAAETTQCPGKDHDGETRPQGSATCDAGADERD